MRSEIPTLDALIVGAGCAGLFLLDAMARRGLSALLVESTALGAGQTTSSQGILHAGLKYSLRGVAGDDATEAAAAAARWGEMLAGSGCDLRAVRRLTSHCYLWRSEGLVSAAAMVGAKLALNTRPEPVAKSARPHWLEHVAGEVLTLGETVIDPQSLLAVLANKHAGKVALGNVQRISRDGDFERVDIRGACDVSVRARKVVLAAGAGNESLARLAGVEVAMQRRPLRQAMIRGALPLVFGHCIDGAKTRVTITSDTTACGDVVWNIGGEVAEVGPKLTQSDFRAHVIAELRAAIPQFELQGSAFTSFDVDRAEPRTKDGRRPARPFAQTSRGITTLWPVKLVLAPMIAEQVAAEISVGESTISRWADELAAPAPAPRPWDALPSDAWSAIE